MAADRTSQRIEESAITLSLTVTSVKRRAGTIEGRRALVVRSSRLLVADVCCYTGDKPYLHRGRGERWRENASMVLGKGYAYDLVNTEVLLSRLSVEDGDLVLPDGMRYRLLAVDLEDETAGPQAFKGSPPAPPWNRPG